MGGSCAFDSEFAYVLNVPAGLPSNDPVAVYLAYGPVWVLSERIVHKTALGTFGPPHSSTKRLHHSIPRRLCPPHPAPCRGISPLQQAVRRTGWHSRAGAPGRRSRNTLWVYSATGFREFRWSRTNERPNGFCLSTLISESCPDPERPRAACGAN